MVTNNWTERYKDKIVDATHAIKQIKRGTRILLGTGCGIPHHLVKELAANADRMADNEIVHLLTIGDTPSADPKFQSQFRHNTFFVSDNIREAVSEGRADYTPAPLSDIPHFFTSRRIPLDVALIQVSPPDEFGYCSLGISVDITKTGAESAELVIAQVNERMPVTHGESYLHVKDIDYLVPHTEPLVEFEEPEVSERTALIGKYAARLVENESTLEIGIGTLARAVTDNLIEGELQDLGIHTEMFSNSIIDLLESGVVTNQKKGINNGRVTASFAMGSSKLYEYVNNNPTFQFKETSYVNDPAVISQNKKMVAINTALEVDLTGQVCADSIGYKFYSGIGGQVDFIRGAWQSEGGKAIICLKSTALNGTVSKIVPRLSEGAGVVTTRGDVDTIVTEYGFATLRGRTIRERVLSLIAIAHPDYRNDLLEAAKKMRYVFEDQVPFLARGTYFPIEYEAVREFEGPDGPTNVRVRLIRPDDADRIKHLFYSLSEESIFFRFLTPLRSLRRQTLQEFYYVDQDSDISLVGVIPENGDPECEKIVAAGRYLLNPRTNQAEFALLVQDEYQNKGIGTFLLTQMMRIAKSKGVNGFIAYVHPKNVPMIDFIHRTGKLIESKLSIEDDQYTFTLKL
ncbi:MAG: GNAT family N-acetyltransferase [Candidatus Thorarchaeota archaeon]|nr:GNAT family N-acetyltransferase [Candidatus Thorarchaeota archaeon]